MADAGSLTGFVGNFVGGFNIMLIAKILGIVVLTLGIIGGIFYFVWNKKKWNLRVEFKLPRSDGRFYDAEWGQGSFNTRQGVVWLKRKGHKKVPMKPFDITKYVQGGDILTVVQTAANNYIPMMPDSFETLVSDTPNKEGTYEEVAVIKMQGDTTESKSWKNSFEREAKSAYSLSSFLKEHGALLAMGLVLFLQLIGFIIIYQRIRPGG